MAALEGARFGGRSFLVPAAEDCGLPGAACCGTRAGQLAFS
jgi:hypothetical protein